MNTTQRKISIFNNKGGVAKTTSIINIAYSLQKCGKKVLVVDCDTQENCFTFFMTNQNADLVLPTNYENINHTTWKRYIALNPVQVESYDYILFDLPPTLSDEVKEILSKSDTVYVPTILGEFEIAGLKKVTDEIHKQGVKLGGVFVTMYQADNDSEILSEFRRVMQSRLLNTVIPYSKTIRESQKSGLPIEDYFIERGVPHTTNAWKIVTAYSDLANEIMRGE